MAWTDLGDWSGLVNATRMNALRDSWLALREVGRGYAGMAWGSDNNTANNTPTKIAHGGTAWNVGSVVQAGSLQAPVAGVYAVFATAVFDGNATGMRMLHLRKNAESTSVVSGQVRGNQFAATDQAAGGRTTVVNLYHELELAANDTIELWVTQTSGGALFCRGGRNRTRYGLRFLGPTITGANLTIPPWLASYPWADRGVMPSSMQTYVRDRQRVLYRHHGAFLRARMTGRDQTVRSGDAGTIDMEDALQLGLGIEATPIRGVTIPKAGRWRLWVNADWMGESLGARYSRLDVNGDYDVDLESRISAGSGHTYASWYTEREFELGEVLTPTVWQDTNDDVNMNGFWFGAGWLGPVEDAPVWNAPRTWTAGENVTLPALFDAELDDKADNLYRLHRLACETQLAASPSISHDNPIVVSWSSAPLNLGGMWAAGSPTRVTLPLAGKYRIYGRTRWKKNDNGHRAAWYRLNGGGTDYELDARQAVGSTSGSTVNNWYAEESFAAGDYIELYVRQTSGAALNLQASDTLLGVSFSGA